ncbi:MAG: hypothetical protein JST51_09905 [Armatimonadetes bacterium]|nr:hypothetical protein [Armatimonadota bacterium]
MVLALTVLLQTTLLTDNRLAAKSDFDDSLTQITDFCAQATQQSGVTLKVDSHIADLKVDVFVENRPLRETLDKVAKALNCVWTPSEAGYRLEMDIPTTNRERNFIKAEEDEDRQMILAALNIYQKCAKATPTSNETVPLGMGMMSAEDRNRLLNPYQKAYEDAQKGTDAAATQRAYDDYAAMSAAAGNPQTTAIGRILLQMDRSAMDRFWKGEPVAASTFPGSQYKLYRSDSTTLINASFIGADGQQHRVEQDLFDIIRYDPASGMLRCSMNVYAAYPKEFGGGASSAKMSGPFSGSSSNLPIADFLKKMPFYQDLEPWMDQDAVEKGFPQSIDTKTKSWPSPWSNHRRRLGDHLRWFHLATGIPVVAQANRSCLWNWINLERGYKTAGEYLKAMMADSDTYCRADDGYVVARNFRFWSHRAYEAPESVWRRIEDHDAKVPMTFDEAVKIAGLLRRDQMGNEFIGYPVNTVGVDRVLTGYDSLKFYASLSKSQRDAARDKGGLSADMLDPVQIQLMQSTVLNLIVENGSCSYEMAKALIARGLEPTTLRQMTFKVTETEHKDYVDYQDEIKDGDAVVSARSQEKRPATQISFTFALGEKETVGQFLTLFKPK